MRHLIGENRMIIHIRIMIEVKFWCYLYQCYFNAIWKWHIYTYMCIKTYIQSRFIIIQQIKYHIQIHKNTVELLFCLIYVYTTKSKSSRNTRRKYAWYDSYQNNTIKYKITLWYFRNVSIKHTKYTTKYTISSRCCSQGYK